ncbi:Uncharacterised protein [BD1-7 clade bacterium]|uniref:Tll0287-like domain-containing protein n=1 Tax=BD1-7 clade bacterium TaxID=2029982 RepID=A0A5S9N6R4_9GAMM|nr:Uncharacterised protein [BD1-7 clade bacterium]CAA0085583.1 Uncharacterised protein [BD1-7 clade bacterium]
MNTILKTAIAATAIITIISLAGCQHDNSAAEEQSQSPKVDARLLSDALHHFAVASRDSYANEDWQQSHALALPAQMARYTAENFKNRSLAVDIHLRSLWPINRKNRPVSVLETEGLKAVAANPSLPFYRLRDVNGQRLFTAIYADVASSNGCINCHNKHPDSAHNDFVGGDVLGGFVVNIKL